MHLRELWKGKRRYFETAGRELNPGPSACAVRSTAEAYSAASYPNCSTKTKNGVYFAVNF